MVNRPAMTRRYPQDFAVGEVYDLGSYRMGTEEIVEFGRRYDPQRYHVDSDVGAESPFGGLVASGWHTAAVFMRLYVDAILQDSAAEGSPGVEDLRWLA